MLGLSGTGRRPIYSIINVGHGAGLLTEGDVPGAYRWNVHLMDTKKLEVHDGWKTVQIVPRAARVESENGVRDLTRRLILLRLPTKTKYTVQQLVEHVGVGTRRVYEVATLLAVFGIWRKASKGMYSPRKRSHRLTPPARKYAPSSPEPTVETRSQKRRRLAASKEKVVDVPARKALKFAPIELGPSAEPMQLEEPVLDLFPTLAVDQSTLFEGMELPESLAIY